MSKSNIEIQPLTVERWDDVATLFGAHGGMPAASVCWRLDRSDFKKLREEGLRKHNSSCDISLNRRM